jgi:hypothetical protein
VDFELRQTIGAGISDQVVEVAEEVDSRLMVTGLRRRSPVGKLIMAAVSPSGS